MAVTDAGAVGGYKAGPDREVATQDLNTALQDKGFLVTSTADIINWARTGSLHWMTSVSYTHLTLPTNREV